MKLNTNTLLFFPLVANALPLTTRNPSAEAIENLLPRADNWCWLNADALVHQPQGCDSTPFDGHRIKDVRGNENFGVRCTARGKAWGSNGITTWDWVPGWGCWIWSGWTQGTCESKFAMCDGCANVLMSDRWSSLP